MNHGSEQMLQCRTLSVFILLSSAMLFVCGGCFANAPVAEAPPRASESIEELLLRRTLVVKPGPKDIENRHTSTVRVFALDLEGEQEEGKECSGSLIGPRLVLTAAHCVCMRRKAITAKGQEQKGPISKANTIIDSSGCATAATVTTLVHDPPMPNEGMRSQLKEYQGKVRPHPEFKLLYDDEGLTVSSNADLAVISLDMPVKDDFPIYKLAKAEVQAGDPITMVGFGLGVGGKQYGERHIGENKVTRIIKSASGGVEFIAGEQTLRDGKAASHLYGGDSGGACLSKTDANVLVGVAGSRAENEKGEKFSVFTSVYSHKDWLDEELKRTAEAGASTR